MLGKIRRKLYRKIRFKTWYRKMSYYHRNRHKINDYIVKFKGAEALENESYTRSLRRDMIKSLMSCGAYYNEYFLFGFEGRDEAYRRSFITEGIRMSYYPRMNKAENTNLFEHKYLTYKKFKHMYKRDMLYITSRKPIDDELLESFESFAAKHPSYIVKPVYAAFGKGVHIDSIEAYPSAAQALEEYHKSGVVIEELIEQAPGMAAIHPQSVNTLRIPSVLIKGSGGEPELRLFNPTLRVGRSGSLIDNLSAGGISALIDPETGRVISDGADKKGNYYKLHPDTGIAFRGFQIPDWEEAVSMVRAAAMAVPDNHYCGWDLALSAKHGWCMVEANCTAQMSGMQIANRSGCKQELEQLILMM